MCTTCVLVLAATASCLCTQRPAPATQGTELGDAAAVARIQRQMSDAGFYSVGHKNVTQHSFWVLVDPVRKELQGKGWRSCVHTKPLKGPPREVLREGQQMGAVCQHMSRHSILPGSCEQPILPCPEDLHLSLCHEDPALQDCVLTVAVVHDPPYSKVYRQDDGSVLHDGLSGQLWKIFEDVLGFKSETHTSESYGMREANGSWSGIVGMVQRGEADVGVALAMMTSQRHQDVQFSWPITPVRLMVTVKVTQFRVGSLADLMSPFSRDTWAAVLVCVALLAACCRLTRLPKSAEICRTSVLLDERGGGAAAARDLGDAFDASTRPAEGVPWRVVFLAGCVMQVALTTCFNARLFSLTAVRSYQLPFPDLPSLQADGYTVTAIRQGALQHMLHDGMLGLGLPADAGTYPRSNAEGYRRVCTDHKFAFVGPRELWRDESALGCEMQDLPQPFTTLAAGMMLPIDDPRLHLFNKLIGRLYSSGILKRLKASWLAAPGGRQRPAAQVERVALSSMAPILGVLAAGTAVAILVLAAELLLAARHGWRRRSRSAAVQSRQGRVHNLTDIE